MKPPFFLILSLVLFLKPSDAQEFRLGLNEGLSGASIHTQIPFEETSRKWGGLYGITFSYSLNSYIKAKAAINYEQKGYISKIYFTDVNGNPIGHNPDNVPYYYDYVTIPLGMDFTAGSKLYGFGGVGIFTGVIYKAYSVWPVFSDKGLTGGSAGKNVDATKFDFGWYSELGIGYSISNRLNFECIARYNASFTTNIKTYTKNNAMRNYAYDIIIGVNYLINYKNGCKYPYNGRMKRSRL